jgi:predicted NBD/HSP70 family sugar kinase
MRVATSKNGKTIHEFRVVPTPKDYEEGMVKFAQLVREARNGMQISSCAGGITGMLNKNKDRLYKSPHLISWAAQPIKERMSEIVESEVHLENDSAMVGLGEAVFGAGKGYKIVAFLTISTGIGGVRIVDGKIDVGVFGFEPGHQIIDADGSINPYFKSDETGNTKGELESLASGSAIMKRWGKLPIEIADEGIWEHIHWVLAQGVCNSVLHWSPEVLVLGGGVMESEKIRIEKIRVYLNEVLKIFPERPRLVNAQLGDLGGLYGSTAYLNVK